MSEHEIAILVDKKVVYEQELQDFGTITLKINDSKITQLLTETSEILNYGIIDLS